MEIKFFLLVFLLISLKSAAAPGTAQKPLDGIRILGLLAGGVESEQVAKLVEQSGIDFKPTDGYTQALRAAGTEESLLKAIGAASRVDQRTSGQAPASNDAVLQHVAQGAELTHKKLYAAAEQEYRAASANSAIDEYRAALHIEPQDALTHYALGGALRMEGEEEGGIAEYREAIRLQPDFDNAHFVLGLALLKKHDYKGALEQFRIAHELNPGELEYRVSNEMLLRE